MRSSPHSLSRLLYLVFAVVLFGAGEAQAKRGIMIITTGTTHSELGPVKKDYVSQLGPDERREIESAHYDTVGYQYSHFGIFWLDIWNWGGEYIVYNKVSENGGIVTPAQAALLMGIEERKLGKPFNYRMPYGLLLVVGLVSLKFVPRMIAKKRQASQPQYQPADRPKWSPDNPPPGAPGNPTAGGPPPMPPPMPPEQ